ncbi:MAG TPA: hypothetical protein VFI60_05570 [Candidatus Acidoferrum sp.]|nr:hypothetical protein [Candidatus Acidoferrum sp.]
MTKLHTLLKKLGACSEAVNWSNGKELTEAWSTCEQPDWMLWLCVKMIGKKGWPTHQQLVLVACACAETVLPIFEKKYPDDSRPRTAIETARKWANGTVEEVRDAAYAAASAVYTAYAADAAAYAAVYAAASAAAAPHDASYAVYTADAADAAAYAAAYAASYADAYQTTLVNRKELADLIRQQLTIPTERSKP